MCIALGPLQQPSLIRQAVWWRGGGNPGVNILRARRRGSATKRRVQRQRSVEFERILSEPLLQDFQ
jgi:hypothetical protein